MDDWLQGGLVNNRGLPKAPTPEVQFNGRGGVRQTPFTAPVLRNCSQMANFLGGGGEGVCSASSRKGNQQRSRRHPPKKEGARLSSTRRHGHGHTRIHIHIHHTDKGRGGRAGNGGLGRERLQWGIMGTASGASDGGRADRGRGGVARTIPLLPDPRGRGATFHGQQNQSVIFI